MALACANPNILERWGTVLRILGPYDLSELKEQAVEDNMNDNKRW